MVTSKSCIKKFEKVCSAVNWTVVTVLEIEKK